jgi:hypothetical protein
MAGKRKIRLVTYTDNQLRGEKVYFLVDENGVMLTEPVRKEAKNDTGTDTHCG